MDIVCHIMSSIVCHVEKIILKTPESKGHDSSYRKLNPKTTMVLPGQPAPKHQHQGSSKAPPFLFFLHQLILLKKTSKT